MKKLLIVFITLAVFLFLGSGEAYAQIKTLVQVGECPQLISGNDTCNADLYVATNDGNTYNVEADYGIDFRTGDSETYGSSQYLSTPSQYIHTTLPIGPDFQLVGTFSTQVQNNTGVCLTDIAGQIFARARVDVYSGQTTDYLSIGSNDVVNIGAMFNLRFVTKSDGSLAVGARVTISPRDSDPDYPAVGYYTVDSSGQVLGLHRYNCTTPHTVTVTLGSESKTITLNPSTNPTEPYICNGRGKDIPIQLEPAPTPTPTPTPPPTCEVINCSYTEPTNGLCYSGHSDNPSCDPNNIYSCFNSVVCNFQQNCSSTPPSQVPSSQVPCPAPTPTPTVGPTITPTPLPPTPTPACTSWDSTNCTRPGGAVCSDWGTTGYCGWDSCLWDQCNKKCTGNTMNLCPTTPTPTPSPVGALNLQVSATPICTTSPPTESITASWSPIGSAYDVVLRGTPGGDESHFCITGTSKTFTKQPPMNGAYTVSAAAYSDATCLNYIQNSAETKPVPTNLACATPTPTVPPGVTPTPTGAPAGSTCEPPPDYSCTTSLGSGCTIGSSSQNVWCQSAASNPNAFCQYCPPAPPPPGGGAGPTCNALAGIRLVQPTFEKSGDYLIIRLGEGVGGDGGGNGGLGPSQESLAQERDNSIFSKLISALTRLFALKPVEAGSNYTGSYWGQIYRNATYGFADDVSNRIGIVPFGINQFFDTSVSSDVSPPYLHYYQLRSLNPVGWGDAASVGVYNNNEFRGCSAYYGSSYSFSLIDTQVTPGAGNSATIRWTIETGKDDGSPQYFTLDVIRGRGIIPWNNVQTVSRQGYCNGQPWLGAFRWWCTVTYRTTYQYTATNLMPNEFNSLSIGFINPDCPNAYNPLEGSGTVYVTAGAGTFTDQPPAPSRLFADFKTYAKVPYVRLDWTSPSNAVRTAVYKNDQRWPKGTGLNTQYDARTNTFYASEKLSDLPPGTYYYGLYTYDSGNCFAYSDQGKFVQEGPKISGEVFVDENRNGQKDGGESCYNQPVTITNTDTSTGATTSHPLTSGCNYTFNIAEGTHQISLTPPVGYALTTPGTITKTLPPDQTGVDFGISNTFVWFQTKEGDVRAKTSVSLNMPLAVPSVKFSLDGAGGSPGIVFYGSVGSTYFGYGEVSSKNWLAQEDFAGPVSTYGSLLAKVNQSGTTISDFSCQPGNNCNSPPASSGVYKMAGDGNLTVSSDWTVKDGKKIVIFVPGNLEIQGGANKTNVDVAAGSFLAFIVKGNITVNSSIGRTASNNTSSNLEGWYITDGNFNTVDTGTSGKRLNIEGLAYLSQGALVNKDRDLGASNKTDPALFISYRTDLALNAPDLFSKSSIQWEEIAP